MVQHISKMRMEKELEQLRLEMNALQNLSEQLPHDINQLEEQLAQKDQQLSDAIKKRQKSLQCKRNQLSSVEPALKRSRQKFEALQLEEEDTIFLDRLKKQL